MKIVYNFQLFANTRMYYNKFIKSNIQSPHTASHIQPHIAHLLPVLVHFNTFFVVVFFPILVVCSQNPKCTV